MTWEYGVVLAISESEKENSMLGSGSGEVLIARSMA